MGFDLPISGAPPRRRAPAPVPVLILVFCAVACGRGDSDDSRGSLSPSAASSSADSLVATPVPASGEALTAEPGGDEAVVGGDPAPSEASAGPSELYYDLTAFDWFLRGEPLVHAGGRYEAAGPPIPMRASELRLLDRYEGVNFYAREGASEGDTVFVPVSERYWIAFTRRSPGPPPAPPADVPPDSIP